jgi:hypothetical protein
MPEHLSERHRQFFVIALGELILVIGLMVGATRPHARPGCGGRDVDRYHRAVLADLHLPRRRTVARRHRNSPRTRPRCPIGVIRSSAHGFRHRRHRRRQRTRHRPPTRIHATSLDRGQSRGTRAVPGRKHHSRKHQVSTCMSWDRVIGMSVLVALTPTMLHVVPLLVALTATAVLTGNAIADTASARGRSPEPSSPPDRPSRQAAE